MRLLNPLGSVLVCVIAVLGVTLTAAQSVAHSPEAPDHGVNETTACTLWAGDVDATNTSALLDGTDASAPELCTLAAGTDIPLDSPPEAVEQWNRGDHREFPQTTAEKSVYPPDADLGQGRYIKDAYVEVFSVQPATRARLSPTNQPLYVAPTGTLLGTVDYRVAVPTDDTTGSHRVEWRLADHDIVETRLLVDGTAESRTEGGHTPELPYELDGYPGDAHTLTIETEVTVDLEKHVEDCSARDNQSVCIDWDTSVEYPSESLTVRDHIEVVEYDLSISGYRARYPNGDLGLVVYKNQPWLGYTLPNGDVRGVWRFYAARDEGWDTLITSTADGERVDHSPLHPLVVNAYPIEPGPTPSPRRTVAILETYGAETTPPTLPENAYLDVLAVPYTASYGIATRTRTTEHSLDAVTAYGLVSGVEADASAGSFADVPINESSLSLSVVNASDESVTVRVSLRDASTDEPINTIDREGAIVVQGERLNTSGNGTVTTTLARPAGGVSARYEPRRWWYDRPGYVGDSDVVYVRGTVLQVLSILYEIGVPVSLFLVSVFMIDRITGWRVWPPWRRL